MELYMVADKEVDKVANMLAGHGCWLIGPKLFRPEPHLTTCMSSPQVFYPFPYFEVQIVDVPGKKLSPWFKVWINPKLVPEASLPYFRDYASPAERNLTSRKYQRVKGEILNWGKRRKIFLWNIFPVMTQHCQESKADQQCKIYFVPN